MRLTINSPLAPCQLPDSGQLSAYQAIGLVTDLAMNHSHYIDSSVGDTLERLMPALNVDNAKVFFDENSRPYGYVSWVTLPEALHQKPCPPNAAIWQPILTQNVKADKEI